MQVGTSVSVNVDSSGLLPYDEVARIATGTGQTTGTGANGWSDVSYRTDPWSNYYGNTGGTINTSGANTGPASLYANYSYLPTGVGNQMTFNLPASDGTYQIVLQFVEPSNISAGQRQFDVVINGTTVQAKVDVFALAGGYDKALALTYTVTASNGQGINIALVNDTGNLAIISGIELRHVNPLGNATPVVNLQLSTDGGTTWNTIATGVSLNQYGQGTFNWTPTAAEVTSGNTALIRAVASVTNTINGTTTTTTATGQSQEFLIAPAGGDYYISPTGNDANSGKDQADPMASLAALLRAYTLGAGDTIHVESGTYTLTDNLVLTAVDSGITIEGYGGTDPIFNRGNQNQGAYVFELNGATGVTLENLNITGGYDGVYGDTNGSSGLTITNSYIYGNSAWGLYINTGNTGLTMTNTQVYLNGSGSASWGGAYIGTNGALLSNDSFWRNQGYGLELVGAQDTVSDSSAYGNESTGIYENNTGGLDVIQNNRVFGNAGDGIDANNWALESGNQVWGNAGWGMNVQSSLGYSGAHATGNTVWGNGAGGIYSYWSLIDDNQVYDNQGYGLYANGYSTAKGNHVYGNMSGGIYVHGWDEVVDNNLIESNAGAGILVDGAWHDGGSGGPNPIIQNNTIVATLYQGVAANAIQVQNSSNSVQIENNILDVSSGGYALGVTPDSEQGFTSDYNLFMLSGGSTAAHWENQSFATQASWFYEVGYDQHSQTGDASFVNLTGPDGQIGWNGGAVAGTSQIINSSSTQYSQSGSWTKQSGGAGGSSYISGTLNNGATPVGSPTQANGASGATQSSWTFTGLTAGYYQIAVTWPPGYYATVNGQGGYIDTTGAYTAYDGSTVVGLGFANEESTLTAGDAQHDFTDGGSTWRPEMTVQVTGTTLTVVLDNLANGSWVEADGVRLVRLAGNYGADDDAQLQSGSIAVDGGDPVTPFLSEPQPNGARVDVGAYGNTANATASASPQIQVLNPAGLTKVQVGTPVAVTVDSSGLLPYDEVARIDTGAGDTSAVSSDGTDANGWSTVNYRTDPYATYRTTTSGTINTSGANTGPASLYSTLSYTNGGVGNQIDFHLPATDGTYQVVLQFVEYNSNISAGSRQFDVVINGTTVQSKVDVFALAGGYNKALALTYTVTASNGQGINIQLINDTGNPAIISGIELRRPNPLGNVTPVVNLQLSTDGGTTWNYIATGVSLSQYGQGTFNWTPTAAEVTSGNTALIRAVASVSNFVNGVWTTTTVTGQSQEFLVASASNVYYVNSGTTGGQYTTAGGNDANSGTDPAHPLASLEALLKAYALGPGDIVYVDGGTYHLLQDVTLTGADSGATFQGSTQPGDPTILNRGNTNAGAYVFDFEGATGVTLRNFDITGRSTESTSGPRVRPRTSPLRTATSTAIQAPALSTIRDTQARVPTSRLPAAPCTTISVPASISMAAAPPSNPVRSTAIPATVSMSKDRTPRICSRFSTTSSTTTALTASMPTVPRTSAATRFTTRTATAPAASARPPTTLCR